MNYLAFILGGLIGWIIYYSWEKTKNTKVCPYCGERIKKEAIFCRWCNKSLITPVEEFAQNIEKITQTVVEDNLKKVSAIVSLSIAKKALEAQIFVMEGFKILNKNYKRK